MNHSDLVSTIIIFRTLDITKTMVSVGAFLCLDQRHIDQYSKITVEDLFAELTNTIVYKEYKSETRLGRK